MNHNVTAEALVLWLPEGEVPTADRFAPDQAEVTPDLETWRYLEDALLNACYAIQDHKKVAWIQSGGAILGPEDIKEACRGLVAARST